MKTKDRILDALWNNEQNFWNFLFSLFFLVVLIIVGASLSEQTLYTIRGFGFLDFILFSLAVFRLVRLFTYDRITQFFRDIFYDIENGVRIRPPFGFRRTVTDLLDCPWCTGVWAALMLFILLVSFPTFTHITILILAASAAASFLQLTANMVGWTAEDIKQNVEGR